MIGTRQMSALVMLAVAMAILFAGSTGPAHAGEFKEWIKNSNAEHYQQTEFKMVDPKGDAFLMRRLDLIPGKLLDALVHNNYRKDDAIEEDDQKKIPYQIGKTKSVDVDRLINRIRQLMRDTPKITPVRGEEHEWCPEAKRYLLYGFWHRLGRFLTGKQKDFPAPLLFRSKLFLLLACGWTSRYAVTGQEKELEARLMTYPDRGVQLHDAFGESYLLNRGNVYLTLLTLENVLAGDPYRLDRDQMPIQKKLAYIRNDSAPVGDNYGAWYHFFGIGMYGLMRPGFVSRSVGEIEALGSYFLEGPDKQETYFNRMGAIFGRKLAKMLKRETWKQPLRPDERTDYMTQGEFAGATGATDCMDGGKLRRP